VEARLRAGERALKERHRIARELHDSVSQALFSTVLHTRTAEKALERQDGGAADSLSQSLRAIGELTRAAQGEMRALIFELGNEAVADGLVAALSRHATTLSAQNGVTIDVEGPDNLPALEPQVAAQLFGIAREALTNVVKHADAASASVQVVHRAGMMSLEIRDNGSGFDPTVTRRGHYGLDSMRSRAAEVDGHLRISSARGQGTVVRVDVPLAAGAPDDSRS
jgi:signal transduction histidine kinase